ncbi:unannotated protein [freshwater metagenome]|uniref:Unannotated protein n=1 Tax=freshwater metagenome TaxID=449393 RepID=A0A6J6Z9S3_9ZZZZ
MQVARKDSGQEVRLEFLSAVLHDRWANSVNREHGNRCTRTHRFVKEDELLDLASALAAVLSWPSDSKPTVACHLLDDLSCDGTTAHLLMKCVSNLRGQQVVVISPEFVPKLLLFFCISDLHNGLRLTERRNCNAFYICNRTGQRVSVLINLNT